MFNNATFENAVSHAMQILPDHDFSMSQDASHLNDAVQWFILLLSRKRNDWQIAPNGQFVQIVTIEDWQWDALLTESLHSRLCFEALRALSIASLAPNNVVPPKLRPWMSDVLGGKLISPKQSRMKVTFAARDLAIIYAVEETVKMGLYATRNDASATTSACDAVAKALENKGYLATSYSRVKSIWLKRNQPNAVWSELKALKLNHAN